MRRLPAADVLVVDDNSPDGTGRWCDGKAAEEPRVRCLHRPRKLGLGTAILAAMREAIDGGYRYLVTMDADFSHPPERLPALVAGMEASVDDGQGDRLRLPPSGPEGALHKRCLSPSSAPT